ncbi:hypothetical protein [Thermocoleostomius sinensis]
MIQQNLDWLFADDQNVFVAGDLLWYLVEGRNTLIVPEKNCKFIALMGN